MSRQIKFRAYQKSTNTMLDWDCLMQSAFNTKDFSALYLVFTQHNEDIVLQQFTGLLDKTGREIYEGDIISGHCLNDGPNVCVVGFDSFGIFYTKIKHYPCEEYENVAMLAQEYSEIVGNVLENPELLS